MTVQELIQKYEESTLPEYKCKKCIWGKTIMDDKEFGLVNVMCMFPRCIKTKHIKDEGKND